MGPSASRALPIMAFTAPKSARSVGNAAARTPASPRAFAAFSSLSAFLATPEARVYRAHEARQIKQFFRWVTMSVTQRTRSVNPNSVVVVDPMALDDYDF